MANQIISKVYLLDTPLKNDYKDTFYFENAGKQQSYFQSKIQRTFNNVSYLRKEQVIRVNVLYDEICTCNYLMYQNTAYSNKWIYCFIKNMKYVSEGTTEIEIETDVIQTYLFDYQMHRSFIEREHVSDDTIGKHTIPEGLETGEYHCNAQTRDTRLDSLGIFVAVNDFADSKWNVEGNLYGGVYSGMAYEFYPCTEEGIDSLNKMLSDYDEDAKAEGINSIFMGPVDLVFDPEITDPGPCTLTPSEVPRTYYITETKNETLDGYKPKNNKLLTYPYNYLYVSNNSGAGVIYHYEKFHTDTCEFEVQGCVTPGFSIRMCPQYYNGLGINHDEGINMGKYAICCWNSDAYTNWQTQNAVNNGVTMTGGILSAGVGIGLIATGAGTGVGIGMATGGIAAIFGTMSSVYNASKIPDQVKGNTNCGDVITGGKNNCFMFHKMSIKKEYAEMIDEFFSAYGYKINNVKIPNTNHRKEHWYTKTIDANITGKIPGVDLQKIKDCYNQGISFWRNPGNIYRYDLANGIV